MANTHLAKQILETALTVAEAESWENMHLHTIAQELNISLDQIRQYYPQKDDIAEAWFDIADSAVLAFKPERTFYEQDSCKRLQHVIITWFEALEPHKRVTGEMLLYKLEFGHIHLQMLGITRISRTVQWFREVARIDTTGLRRILEETGTTAIYLAAFTHWLHDETPGFQKTRKLLKQAS